MSETLPPAGEDLDRLYAIEVCEFEEDGDDWVGPGVCYFPRDQFQPSEHREGATARLIGLERLDARGLTALARPRRSAP